MTYKPDVALDRLLRAASLHRLVGPEARLDGWDLIRRLGEAGASAEIIAIAVEAVEAVVEDRRAADRERKRRQRHGVSRDVPGQSVTSRDPYPPKNTNQPSLPTIENLQTPYPSPIVPRPSKFDTFWAEYPNKVGKRAAEASFAKALKVHVDFWCFAGNCLADHVVDVFPIPEEDGSG